MRFLYKARAFLACAVLISNTVLASDDLEPGTTWNALKSEGRSVVFGRIQGRFDGTEYRGRKIRVQNKQSGKEYAIPVEQGRGFFEASLPVGSYSFVSIEAVYFPPIRPMKPLRYPPVQQRYEVRPLPESGLPTFPVIEDRPVYLGTIRSGVGGNGLVYEGHSIEIVDEYPDAWSWISEKYRSLFDSMTSSGVEPTRYFFLKPADEPSLLELVDAPDPMGQARDYLEDGKFRQALSWLETFMPASDDERVEIRLLVGEIQLADKKYAEAIEELGEVLLDKPENLRALRLLARAHAFEGHREDALGLYRGLFDLLPDDAEASLHLGYQYALSGEAESAKDLFDSAFRENFDYLLHDLSPYALALRTDGANYVAPEVVDGAVRMPSTMRSRRSSQGAFALLLDHRGNVVAVHLTQNAGEWAPAMMMSVIRAKFRPARLNGVAIPCLIIIGADNAIEAVN